MWFLESETQSSKEDSSLNTLNLMNFDAKLPWCNFLCIIHVPRGIDLIAPSVPFREFFLENSFSRILSREFLEKFYNFLFLISREITVFLENLQCRKIIINPICFQKRIFGYFKLYVNHEEINTFTISNKC